MGRVFLCRLANLGRDLFFYSENEGGGLESGLGSDAVSDVPSLAC